MQEPLLRADLDLDQHNADPIPDAVGRRGGWYPRWWIISSLFCTAVVIGGYLLWNRQGAPCMIHGAFAGLCQANSWPEWGQDLLVIPGIWLIFLFFWVIALMFGTPAIEIPRPRYGIIARAFRAISEFGPVQPILLFYGLVALFGIILMWWYQRFDPATFALAAIVVFVAHCSFFHTLDPQQRKWYLAGYGMSALGGIILMVVLGRYIGPIIVTEFVILGVGIWSLFFWNPQPARPLTPQEQLDASLSNTVTPLYVLRSTWPMNRLFPNPPIH